MNEQTVDTLIDQALTRGLIKNKTEGRKLKKVGLVQLLEAHKAEPYEPEKLDAECAATAKAYAASQAVVVDGEAGALPNTPPPSVETIIVHKDRALGPTKLPSEDWPVRALVAPEEKNLHEDKASVTDPVIAANILARYGNSFRNSRGGVRRDKSKSKAARRARRKNRK